MATLSSSPARVRVRRRRIAPAPAARSVRALGAALAMLAAAAGTLRAQYFGRNKVQYETFDVRVLEAPHFDVYHYPAESLATADAARMAERWYARLSSLLNFQFKRRPLVFYADHPDFQQTNTTGEMISQGTGGFTEPLRDRVVLPFTGVYADNDHVLGHELVHVFQYGIADTMRSAPGARGRGIEELPLWLIEGMAEYLSIGREDANTAMWLRDAVLRKDLPTIRKLSTDPRYFPYRYGEALWAYVGGKWGDTTVNTLYRTALRMGFEPAIKKVLGMSDDSLSKEWHAAIRAAYTPVMEGLTRPRDAGARLLPGERSEAGMMEVSPALSPDGRYVAFLSSRNLVSIDLFVAETETGRIVKHLTSPNSDQHFGSLSFISAAGSWSPDGRQLAYITVNHGDNEIAVFDVGRRRVVRQFNVRGVGGITDVAWGPGGAIALSGTRGGISDLYLLDPRTGQVRQLTNDRYADLQPAWSPDGRTLAFATDRGGRTDFDRLTYGPMRLATIDVESGDVRLLPAFPQAKQITPQFAPDGRELYFVSDRDGISNVYRLSLDDGTVYQVTRVATGVSGITPLSPALTVAAASGRVVFSVFDNAGEILYRLEPDQARGVAVETADGAVARAAARALPPADTLGASRVSAYLADADTGLPGERSFPAHPYHAKLGLEYVGSSGGVGVGFGGVYGTQLGGGVQAYFSDMLDNHVVGATLSASGDVRDIGGEALYLNQRRRLNWAVSGSHIPYILGAFVGARDTAVSLGGRSTGALVYDQTIARIYFDQASLGARYPLSATRRVELALSANRESFGLQTFRSLVIGNQVVQQVQTNGGAPPGVNYAEASLALVGDYSTFGMTSPMAGGRYRFEASPIFGGLNFGTLLADYRRYFLLRPVTIAVRGLHYGRYGPDAERSDWLAPIFIGYSSLVRGYDVGSFSAAECTPVAGNASACPEFDRLLGSRIAVASAELRIPFMGPKELALIPSRFLPIELAPFVDAGTAWTSTQSPTLEFSRTTTARVPVVSTGLSARFNLFGAAVLEAYYALPFQRPAKQGVWGFQLQPGW